LAVGGKSAGAASSDPKDDPTGRGEYDPATGLWEWYERPEETLTWRKLLRLWDLIEADLQDAGVDVESGVLRRRSARWLQTKLIGLLHADTRVARQLGYAIPLNQRPVRG